MDLHRDDKQSPVLAFVEALRRREWRALRRLLLGLFVPGIPVLFQFRSSLGTYQVYVWAAVSLLFFVLLLGEFFSRPLVRRFGLGDYTSTIRGLVPFGEDDVAVFATLGRGTDVARVVNALLDPQFRIGVLFAESGCGKTSLLRAAVIPELKRRGYAVCIDDINNLEGPFDSVVRLLRTGATAAQGADVGNSRGGSPDLSWLALYDSASRQAFLILDQFEQFFLHYGKPEGAEPFLYFLEEWWTLHSGSQLRVLFSIREDYLGKLAVIQERLAYVQTVHNHLRLKRFMPDDAVEVLRSMAAESNLEFHESVVRQACREDLASKEDGTISPVDLQILATGIRDLPSGMKGFTADALRSLGGLEGALERYLSAQLFNLSEEDRKAALAVLRLLSEHRQGVLTGWLSAAEIVERLAEPYGADRVGKMIRWLADRRVRLIVENDLREGNRYRLVHDRLVAAVLKVSGQALIETERAGILLDRRVSEYLGNDRRSRYLLAWNEWRLIVRHQALLDWGGRETEKRELLLRSGRRIKSLVTTSLTFVVLLCVAWGTWEFQPRVLLWRTQQELAADIQRISTDPDTLLEIATALAPTAVQTKDSKLLDQAVSVAQKIDNPWKRYAALDKIATAMAYGGVNGKDDKLLDQAVTVAQEIDEPSYKAGTLEKIASARAWKDDKANVFRFLEYVPQDINDPTQKAIAQSQIATAKTTGDNKANTSQLLDLAEAVVQMIDDPVQEAEALSQVATARATADDKANASRVFDLAVVVAQKIDGPVEEAEALSQIATARATADDKANASRVFDLAVAVAQKIDFPVSKASALTRIATARVTAHDQANASKLLDLAMVEAHKADHIDFGLLQELSRAYASLGYLRVARRLTRGLPINEETLSLVSILRGWAEKNAPPARQRALFRN